MANSACLFSCLPRLCRPQVSRLVLVQNVKAAFTFLTLFCCHLSELYNENVQLPKCRGEQALIIQCGTMSNQGSAKPNPHEGSCTARDSPVPHCSPYEMQDTQYYDPQLCSVCDIVYELIPGWDKEN